jgi:hypothetical protein
MLVIGALYVGDQQTGGEARLVAPHRRNCPLPRMDTDQSDQLDRNPRTMLAHTFALSARPAGTGPPTI